MLESCFAISLLKNQDSPFLLFFTKAVATGPLMNRDAHLKKGKPTTGRIVCFPWGMLFIAPLFSIARNEVICHRKKNEDRFRGVR